MKSKLNQVRFEQRPVAPGKVVCVGRNFIEHISELGNEVPEEMVIFTKPNSAITDELQIHELEEIHYEGELSFLVEEGTFVGVAFGLDLTKRVLQGKLKAKGLPWERAKAFDGSALFSDFVPIPGDLNSLELVLRINETLVQRGRVREMIYKPPAILEEIRSFMSLHDGDIIMTGTPKGVGRIQAGQKLHGQIVCEGVDMVECTWEVV